MLLTELGHPGHWGTGTLWGFVVEAAQALTPSMHAWRLAAALSGVLAPLAAGFVALVCLEALLAGRGAPHAPPTPAELVCAAACGLVLAWSPCLRWAAASAGPWALTYALTAGYLWRAQCALNRGDLGRWDGPVLGVTAGLALANSSWSAPMLAAGGLPGLYRMLSRGAAPREEGAAGRGAARAITPVLGLAAGLLPLALARWRPGAVPSDGAWEAARDLTHTVSWSVGVAAAPLAARHAGGLLLAGLSPAATLACLVACGIAVSNKMRRPHAEATGWRTAVVWPALCALVCGWSPAWGAAGAEAPMALFPCLAGFVVLATLGVAWAAAAVGDPTVRAAAVGAMAALLLSGAALTAAAGWQRDADAGAVDEYWATRLASRLASAGRAVVVVDDDLAPRALVVDALLRARAMRRPPAHWDLVSTIDPTDDATWPRIAGLLGREATADSAEERWRFLLSPNTEVAVLVTSWREPLELGVPLRARWGLLSGAGGDDGRWPSNGVVLHRRAKVVEMLSRGAADDARTLIEGLRPWQIECRDDLMRAAACRALGQPGEAREATEEAVDLDPLSRLAWEDHARSLAAAGLDADAAQAVRVARALDRRAAREWLK